MSIRHQTNFDVFQLCLTFYELHPTYWFSPWLTLIASRYFKFSGAGQKNNQISELKLTYPANEGRDDLLKVLIVKNVITKMNVKLFHCAHI